MRRAIIILGLLALCLVGWNTYSRRSARVEITPDHALTYTVAWGWGMDQQLTLDQRWVPRPIASSEWIAIWKRPYNSGAAIYATEQGERYFIGTTYKMLVVDLAQHRVFSSCDEASIPARTPLAERLLSDGREGYERNDPAGLDLARYILPDIPAGAVPNEPPPSKYYQGLRYLGRFGIVAPERRVFSRGNEVRFAPASREPEPRLALQLHCG